MDSGSIADRVRGVAEQAAIDHGLELVHVEIAGPEGHPIIRVFIDKPGGVTHEDCSGVSTQIGTVLDVEDFIHAKREGGFANFNMSVAITDAFMTALLDNADWELIHAAEPSPDVLASGVNQ